jgi:hypothetical protein
MTIDWRSTSVAKELINIRYDNVISRFLCGGKMIFLPNFWAIFEAHRGIHDLQQKRAHFAGKSPVFGRGLGASHRSQEPIAALSLGAGRAAACP